MPQTLTVAVCICNDVTLSDFITPVEILSGLNLPDNPAFAMAEIENTPYRVKIDYLAPTMEPVKPLMPFAPTVNPTMTYDAAIKSGTQFDIVWVPAGPLLDPATGADMTPREEINFIKHQAPGAKYMMSACAGTIPLASAGVLEGKRATTNKMLFRAIEATTSKNITWVPKARWVVDGNVWTSSGVTAGSDMALAFLEHLVGAKAARQVRGTVEIPERGEGDDPFAEFFGLV